MDLVRARTKQMSVVSKPVNLKGADERRPQHKVDSPGLELVSKSSFTGFATFFTFYLYYLCFLIFGLLF